MQQPAILQPTPRKFLELTLTGSGKALYLPSDSILSYEFVPEGKNEDFPETGTFLRYNYGEGLMFAIVAEELDKVREQVGTDGFLHLHLIDDEELYLRNDLIIAMQEKEDENITATQISLRLDGQVGSLFVKDSFADIKKQREG